MLFVDKLELLIELYRIEIELDLLHDTQVVLLIELYRIEIF